MNTCIQCGEEHEKKGAYCSKRCIDKAYRDRKKGKSDALPLIGRVKSSRIEIPKETGPKLKWCNFCGASLEHSKMLQFCNSEHQKDYYKTISRGGTLKLRIDAKTVIETKKYNRVQEVIDYLLQSRKQWLVFS
jgi:hypothetical protein